MKPRMESRSARGAAIVALAVWTALASAAVPVPPNDTPATADIIDAGALPALIYGTTVGAHDDITTMVDLPAITNLVDGPDVYYTLTPLSAGTYRVQLIPWQHAPLRSSEWQFTLYALDDGLRGVAGLRAPGSARPVTLDVALNAGTQYYIGVDYDAATNGRDNYPFTLVVDALDLNNPDNCGLVENLGAAVPAVRINSITGSVNDFAFTPGVALCSVATTTAAGGNDHVYKFTAPYTGDFAIELVGDGFDPVLHVNTACPPDFVSGCVGAANHSTGTTSGGRHELIVVSLLVGLDYYIYADNSSTTALTGNYTLIVADAFDYEITEVEPNDSPALPSPLGTPLNGGQIAGRGDVDYYAVTGGTGDRVYAWANNGGTSNSTLDLDLTLVEPDGATVVEFDDEDADGASAPVTDLHFVYSTSSPVIAGARLTRNGTFTWRVNAASATGTVSRYRLHVGHIAAARQPLSECEPNDDLAQADRSGKNYFAGVIDTAADVDFYTFYADAGQRVFVACDGDPERDSTGADPASTDPKAFAAKLVVYDPDGDVLIDDISDASSVQGVPDYPAQGGFFVARSSGWHYVAVLPQSSASAGPAETYELAIFLDDAAPVLTDEDEPTLTLTPDYVNDKYAGSAADSGSGLCAVELVAATNLQITNLTTLPNASATFDVLLINPAVSGFGKLVVTDCQGNTACETVRIDVIPPVCGGFNFARRTVTYFDGPAFIPDNEPAGPGIDATVEVLDPGLITDINVTGTFETTSASDLDIFLIGPDNTTVEIQTDRGSSFAFNIKKATWDDAAAELMPLLSGDEPYTGTWLPEGSLATFNGKQAQGTWKLNVRDDSSSENGGSRLVYYQLEIEGTFAGPEIFGGTASDAAGFDGGIASIVLTNAVNTQIELAPDFVPGMLQTTYFVTLVNTAQGGTGTVIVTDMQGNTCSQPISLAGLPDNTAPANAGGVTDALTYRQEVQADVPSYYPPGILSTIHVADTRLIGEVEAELTIDTRDLGRLAARVNKAGSQAILINRVGMDERDSVGLTKNTLWLMLDDDAPQADDAHLEPALGTIPFMGLHQPDGRGEFFGNGINTDKRDNLLSRLANVSGAGDWVLNVADFRAIGTTRSEVRRWALTLKSPCGPQYYVGVAKDLTPGSGIASITLAPSATNLSVAADFTPGAERAEYRVSLVNPAQPGTGTVEIADMAGNTTSVPVALAAASNDQIPPGVGGSVVSGKFQGVADDNIGIASVELAPWATNLQLETVNITGPGATFVVSATDPNANGRGYVRVTDTCGWRSHKLIELDRRLPQCTGAVGQTKRYRSTDTPQVIPDLGFVVSSIAVPDTDRVEDVNITLNIHHGFDDDLDVSLIAPQNIPLFNDIGSTGNDFIDTVIDDEAAGPMPDSASAAPFTGSWQPLGGPALFALDGGPAAGTYTLQVVDDKANDTGVLDNWALTIQANTFPQRYDGRVEDSATFDTGVCTIALQSGALNLTLTADPFTAGDKIVRYSVALTNPQRTGVGRVMIQDCAGNTCLFNVRLIGLIPSGDVNCDGAINFKDIDPLVLALSGQAAYDAVFPNCNWLTADINGDGNVTFKDIDPFVLVLSTVP